MKYLGSLVQLISNCSVLATTREIREYFLHVKIYCFTVHCGNGETNTDTKTNQLLLQPEQDLVEPIALSM
jgi:hypothetical protein